MAAPIAEADAAGEPSRAPNLAARQIGVAVGAGLAAVVSAALYVAGGHPVGPEATRPLVWAGAAFGPLLSLAVAVGALANRRFFSATDIDAAAGGPPSAGARMAQAIIQNTLEQTALALALYALLAILLPASALTLPWVLSAAFVLGRLAFAIGYSRGAAGRAFGFGLTFYPTAVELIYAATLAWQALT